MSKYKLKLNYTPEELKELKFLKHAPFHSTLLVVEITALDGQFKDLHQKWLEIPAVDELKFMTDIYNASWDRVDWPKEKLYVVHDQATDDYNDNDYDDYNNDYDEFSNVERPEHYNSYPIETIEAIAGQSTSEEFEGWLKGNIIKYVSRYKFKNGSEDLSKAHFYIKVLEDWDKGYELRSILDEIEEGEY